MKAPNRFLSLLFSAAVCLALSTSAALANDPEGSSDHPLLSRMPKYHIDSYRQSDFDRMQMLDAEGNEVPVEGRTTQINYCFTEDSGSNVPSELQILRNYRNALAKIGGTAVYEDYDSAHRIVMQLQKDSQEIWTLVTAWNQGHCYTLDIVEKQGMQQDIVADAASLANDLKQSGRVALYGIYFDSGKAHVKPESEPSLKQIAELLKRDSALKLYVVGHTDNQGELSLNQKLSQERAKAVVAALSSKYGVTASRLNGQGVGPVSPVASNDSEEGRARNRRVELVKQ